MLWRGANGSMHQRPHEAPLVASEFAATDEEKQHVTSAYRIYSR